MPSRRNTKNEIRKTNFFETGFTLVELMISIAIIAILSAVALGSVSAIQKSGRDTQRQADIRSIQSALQQFYADQSRYPDNITLSSTTSITSCTGVNGCSSPTKTYMSTVPKDPTSGTPYCYTAYLSSSSSTQCTPSANSGLCHYYKLDAKLENTTGAITCGNGGGTGYSFEVTPL